MYVILYILNHIPSTNSIIHLVVKMFEGRS